MRKLIILLFIILAGRTLYSQDAPKSFKVVTVVESIIPGGLGRSRMIENNSTVDVDNLTTERNSGTDSKQNKVKRKDIKVDELSETKLLNFYSLTGINFQNIASNDAVIEARLTALAKEGWKLAFAVSGVESNAGGQDGEGIFVTRMIFSR